MIAENLVSSSVLDFAQWLVPSTWKSFYLMLASLTFIFLKSPTSAIFPRHSTLLSLYHHYLFHLPLLIHLFHCIEIIEIIQKKRKLLV